MDNRWESHNLHQSQGIEAFASQDPTLNSISGLPLVYESPLLDTLAAQPAGIHTVVGPRKAGMTTLLKQLMLRLMKSKGVNPKRINYVAGELLSNGKALQEVLSELTAEPGAELRYILVDNATYIWRWGQAVKALAEAGALQNVFLLLAGHDETRIVHPLKKLQGDPDGADRMNFRYDPLNFLEFCSLHGKVSPEIIDTLSVGRPGDALPEVPPAEIENLEKEFRQFHRTGGYLCAINDFEQRGRVEAATHSAYYEQLREDVDSQQHHETIYERVLDVIHSRYATHFSYNALAKELLIEHCITVIKYFELLERMNIIFVLPAVADNRIAVAPKRVRKIYFRDPFIYHAIYRYLTEGLPQYELDARPAPLRGDRELAKLAEGSIISDLRRVAETYYVKAYRDVSALYVRDDDVWTIDVNWTSRVRSEDLYKLEDYENAVVAARVREEQEVDGFRILPAPVVALRVSRLQPE